MASHALRITGYSDPLSVQPGETIRFFVHSENGEGYRAQIVRLIHGDTNPEGPGYKEAELDSPANGEYPGRPQPVFAGSYVFVPDNPRLSPESFTLAALIYPTTPEAGVQGIATKWSAPEETGFGLFVDDNSELSLWIGKGKGQTQHIASGRPLFRKVWYLVAASYDAASGEVCLYQEPIVTATNGGHGMRLVEPMDDTRAVLRSQADPGSPATNDCPLIIAGATLRSRAGRFIGGGHHAHVREPVEIPEQGANFNGRIERPCLAKAALDRSTIERVLLGAHPLPTDLAPSVVGRWDFAANLGANAASQQVIDRSQNGLHGHCVNLPGSRYARAQLDRRPDEFRRRAGGIRRDPFPR